MRLKIIWAFLVWMFMKVFGGTFATLEAFREELKRGAPESILATLGFMVISLIGIAVVMLVSAAVIDDTRTVQYIGTGLLWTVCLTFVYNVIKAAWECFVQERQEMIDMLRNS